MEPHFYNVNLTWTKDRKGLLHSPELPGATSDDGFLEVATPPQFPKGIAGVWSPEHLFTAAVCSCFMTTFLAIAESSDLKFKDFNCKSRGKLEKIAGKLVMSEVYIEPTITICNEEDRYRALRILTKSELGCLITNSIDSKVIMTPIVQSALCEV